MYVHTLQLTDDELRILRASVSNYVNSFSHDEGDVLRAGKQLRERIENELEHPTPGVSTVLVVEESSDIDV